jgi:hypothetical protein
MSPTRELLNNFMDSPEQIQYLVDYNNLGVRNPTPFDLNPASNTGIVYNPANTPSNPGAFISGQTISDLTFVSGYSQRRIRITMNPADNPVQVAGSIAIIDENNNIIFLAGEISSGVVQISPVLNQTGLIVTGIHANSTTLAIIDNQNTSSTNTSLSVTNESSNASQAAILATSGHGNIPLMLVNSTATSTNFYREASLNGVTIYKSNGTDPNGVLTGNKGDICLNCSGAGQITYNNNGSTAWTFL